MRRKKSGKTETAKGQRISAQHAKLGIKMKIMTETLDNLTSFIPWMRKLTICIQLCLANIVFIQLDNLGGLRCFPTVFIFDEFKTLLLP